MSEDHTEVERLFAVQAAGSKVGMPLQNLFWGAYFGSLTDQFGIRSMSNCSRES